MWGGREGGEKFKKDREMGTGRGWFGSNMLNDEFTVLMKDFNVKRVTVALTCCL